MFNFLFNVEQNVFLSCNLMSVAMCYGLYVSRNSKSSEFINQIGVFVFFSSTVSCCCCCCCFFCSLDSFGCAWFFVCVCDSVTCLQDQVLCTFFFHLYIEKSRCEKWCCRDTTWWVERSKCMLLAIVCMACACTAHFYLWIHFLKYKHSFPLKFISFRLDHNFFHCYLLVWIIGIIKMREMDEIWAHFNSQ